jgi:hypothetical protein
VKTTGRKNFIFGLDFYLKKWSRSRVVILFPWKFIDCHSFRRGFPHLLLTDPLKIFFTYIYVDVFECRRQHLLTDLFWSRQPCTCLTRRACWPSSGAGRPSTSAPPAARSIRACTTKNIKIWHSHKDRRHVVVRRMTPKIRILRRDAHGQGKRRWPLPFNIRFLPWPSIKTTCRLSLKDLS